MSPCSSLTNIKLRSSSELFVHRNIYVYEYFTIRSYSHAACLKVLCLCRVRIHGKRVFFIYILLHNVFEQGVTGEMHIHLMKTDCAQRCWTNICPLCERCSFLMVPHFEKSSICHCPANTASMEPMDNPILFRLDTAHSDLR